MAKTARHEYDSTKIVFLGFFPKEFRVTCILFLNYKMKSQFNNQQNLKRMFTGSPRVWRQIV